MTTQPMQLPMKPQMADVGVLKPDTPVTLPRNLSTAETCCLGDSDASPTYTGDDASPFSSMIMESASNDGESMGRDNAVHDVLSTVLTKNTLLGVRALISAVDDDACARKAFCGLPNWQMITYEGLEAAKARPRREVPTTVATPPLQEADEHHEDHVNELEEVIEGGSFQETCEGDHLDSKECEPCPLIRSPPGLSKGSPPGLSRSDPELNDAEEPEPDLGPAEPFPCLSESTWHDAPIPQSDHSSTHQEYTHCPWPAPVCLAHAAEYRVSAEQLEATAKWLRSEAAEKDSAHVVKDGVSSSTVAAEEEFPVVKDEDLSAKTTKAEVCKRIEEVKEVAKTAVLKDEPQLQPGFVDWSCAYPSNGFHDGYSWGPYQQTDVYNPVDLWPAHFRSTAAEHLALARQCEEYADWLKAQGADPHKKAEKKHLLNSAAEYYAAASRYATSASLLMSQADSAQAMCDAAKMQSSGGPLSKRNAKAFRATGPKPIISDDALYSEGPPNKDGIQACRRAPPKRLGIQEGSAGNHQGVNHNKQKRGEKATATAHSKPVVEQPALPLAMKAPKLPSPEDFPALGQPTSKPKANAAQAPPVPEHVGTAWSKPQPREVKTDKPVAGIVKAPAAAGKNLEKQPPTQCVEEVQDKPPKQSNEEVQEKPPQRSDEEAQDKPPMEAAEVSVSKEAMVQAPASTELPTPGFAKIVAVATETGEARVIVQAKVVTKAKKATPVAEMLSEDPVVDDSHVAKTAEVAKPTEAPRAKTVETTVKAPEKAKLANDQATVSPPKGGNATTGCPTSKKGKSPKASPPCIEASVAEAEQQGTPGDDTAQDDGTVSQSVPNRKVRYMLKRRGASKTSEKDACFESDDEIAAPIASKTIVSWPVYIVIAVVAIALLILCDMACFPSRSAISAGATHSWPVAKFGNPVGGNTVQHVRDVLRSCEIEQARGNAVVKQMKLSMGSRKLPAYR